MLTLEYCCRITIVGSWLFGLYLVYDLLNWKTCGYWTTELLVQFFVIYNMKCDIYL